MATVQRQRNLFQSFTNEFDVQRPASSITPGSELENAKSEVPDDSFSQ